MNKIVKLLIILSVVIVICISFAFTKQVSWNKSDRIEKINWSEREDSLFKMVLDENPEMAAYYQHLDSLKNVFMGISEHISIKMMFTEETFVYLKDEYKLDKQYGNYVVKNREKFLPYSNELLSTYGKYRSRGKDIEKYMHKFKMISIIPKLNEGVEEIKELEKESDELLIKTFNFKKEGEELLKSYLK